MELLIFCLCSIVALAAIGTAIAAYYAWRSMPQPNQPGQFHQKISGTTSHHPNAEARSRLLNMVAGDQATAYRLVDHVRASNPRQTENWCWEKAVEDLIRDRR